MKKSISIIALLFSFLNYASCEEFLHSLLKGHQLDNAKSTLKRPASVLSDTTGKWVKFEKGSDHQNLVKLIRGKNTGWEWAGYSNTAKAHLSEGDIYIYVTKNRQGELERPRVAIRMKEDKIWYVLGVAGNQSVDSYISKTDILEKKFLELGTPSEDFDRLIKDVNKSPQDFTYGEYISDNMGIEILGRNPFGDIDHLTPEIIDSWKETKGRWVKFKKGSEPLRLLDLTINTKWYWQDNLEAAFYALNRSDVNIYFSKDKAGKFTIPRVAIMVEDDLITSIMGVGPVTKIDPYIADTNIILNKLKNLGKNGNDYFIKFHDMKALNDIEKKSKKGEILSRSEISFLYEEGRKIEQFGDEFIFESDPRIKEIRNGQNLKFLSEIEGKIDSGEELSLNEISWLHGVRSRGVRIDGLDGYRLNKIVESRDLKEDLSLVIGIPKDQISISDEWIKKETQYSYGNVVLPFTSEGPIKNSIQLKGINKLPNIIREHLDMDELESLEDYIFPEYVGKSMHARYLRYARKVRLPKYVRGNVYLGNLEFVEEVILPEYVGEFIYLTSKKDLEGLVIPDTLDKSKIILADD